MRTWHVWTEGYHVEPDCEGRPAPATYLGEWPGETFADACEAWAKSQTLDALYPYKSYTELFRHQGEWLAWWGCRFFDNEADARKSFG